MTTKHNQNEYFPWEPDKQNHTVKPKKIALSRIIELGYISPLLRSSSSTDLNVNETNNFFITFYQKLYAIGHISRIKYIEKSVAVTVTELFAADLGSLWGLGCCPAVLRVERLTGASSASTTGSVGSAGNSAT